MFRTTRTIQNNNKKWGAVKKLFFAFFVLFFLVFGLITLEQYRTNIEQPRTTKKIFKIKRWGANFVMTILLFFAVSL